MVCGTCAEQISGQTRVADGVPAGALGAMARVLDIPIATLRRTITSSALDTATTVQLLRELSGQRLRDKLQEIQTPEKVAEHADLLNAALVESLYMQSDEPTRCALLEHCADRLTRKVMVTAVSARHKAERTAIATHAFDALLTEQRESLIADRALGVRVAVADNATTLTPAQCLAFATDDSISIRAALAENTAQEIPRAVRRILTLESDDNTLVACALARAGELELDEIERAISKFGYSNGVKFVEMLQASGRLNSEEIARCWQSKYRHVRLEALTGNMSREQIVTVLTADTDYSANMRAKLLQHHFDDLKAADVQRLARDCNEPRTMQVLSRAMPVPSSAIITAAIAGGNTALFKEFSRERVRLFALPGLMTGGWCEQRDAVTDSHLAQAVSVPAVHAPLLECFAGRMTETQRLACLTNVEAVNGVPADAWTPAMLDTAIDRGFGTDIAFAKRGERHEDDNGIVYYQGIDEGVHRGVRERLSLKQLLKIESAMREVVIAEGFEYKGREWVLGRIGEITGKTEHALYVFLAEQRGAQ